MKKHFLTSAFILCSYIVFAQVGNSFPKMEAENLKNQFINLPNDLKGKHALICLAYSKKSEEYLGEWFQPIYNNFIYKPTKPRLFSFTYDIHVYFVPMFTGAKRPAYQKVMNKVKGTVDPKLQDYVLFYKGSLKQYKNVLNFEGGDTPYFYVIDPDGKIIETVKGKYTDSKMQEIINAVEPAMVH